MNQIRELIQVETNLGKRKLFSFKLAEFPGLVHRTIMCVLVPAWGKEQPWARKGQEGEGRGMGMVDCPLKWVVAELAYACSTYLKSLSSRNICLQRMNASQDIPALDICGALLLPLSPQPNILAWN